MSFKRRQNNFETECIHRGLNFNLETGALTPPIYASSTFRVGNSGGFDYTRSGNPNFTNLEETLAALEGAQYATAFSSGVAAVTAVVSSFKSGDLILAEENLYGCTYRLFEQVFAKFGLRIHYLDFTRRETLEEIAKLRPQLIWLESPTNPLLKIIDIAEVAKTAKKVGTPVLVDNTFASSCLQQPLLLGADLSLLSCTKYINGHCDALGGVVCTNSESWASRLGFAQKGLGLNPSPFDSWLISRGIKTLQPRMELHSANALLLAGYLEQHPLVEKVIYPFLSSHPQYRLAKKQMRLGSGIVSARFAFGMEQTQKFLRRLKLFIPAESLGGVESLVCHPASMTHAALPPAVKERLGITDSLVRFSVGIESREDLICDVDQALSGLAEQRCANG